MQALIPSLRRWSALAAVLAIGAGLVACGDDESGDSAEEGSGDKGAVTVKAAEFTWSTAKLTNAILSEVVEDYPELGVEKLETKPLDPPVAWAGAQRGDIELLTEVALPNQQPLADKAKAEVDLLSETYGDANQGWFVPKYAVESGGEAEGLKSVTQLNDYKDAFDGKLIDADPGWISTQQNKARLKGYGIDYQHVTSGEAAELAQLKRAVQRKEPIVLYLYRPHWVFTEYEVTQLEEPNAYKEGCFDEGGEGDCAMPPYSAAVAARKDLAEKAPEFVAMLKRFQMPLEDIERMLREVDLEKKPVDEVARQWIEDNQDKVKSWVDGA